MTFASFHRLMLLIVISMYFGSCASKGKLEQPVATGLPVSAEQLEALQTALQARANSYSSYKSLFRTRIQAEGEGGVSLRHAVVAREPASIRIEALPLQGAYALSIFVSLEGDAALFERESGEVRRGNFGRKLLKRMLGVNVEEKDLVALLAGDLPPSLYDINRLVDMTDLEVFFDAEKQEYTLIRGDSLAFARVDAVTSMLTFFQASSAFSGDATVQMSLDGQVSDSSAVFPRTITLILPEEELSISLKRTALKVAGELPDSLFRLGATLE